VGLEIGWPAIERLYDDLRMAPQVPAAASRVAVPVYAREEQIGRATSTTWSPILKKLIALATIDAPYTSPGTGVDFELTVEAVRHRVPATVVQTPFFNPPRKTATPPKQPLV
jgi:aminomethyltransferase